VLPACRALAAGAPARAAPLAHRCLRPAARHVPAQGRSRGRQREAAAEALEEGHAPRRQQSLRVRRKGFCKAEGVLGGVLF
jgi:hypothetical protein